MKLKDFLKEFGIPTYTVLGDVPVQTNVPVDEAVELYNITDSAKDNLMLFSNELLEKLTGPSSEINLNEVKIVVNVVPTIINIFVYDGSTLLFNRLVFLTKREASLF